MAFIWAHPLTANLEIGSLKWFEAQRKMVEEKPLVKATYEKWYELMIDDIRSVITSEENYPVLEIGSGSSFLKNISPEIISSDIIDGVADRVIDAQSLPFADSSLKAILMSHVFHHIPNIELFLQEAQRCLVPNGVISMIDCASTLLAKLFFRYIHPEPFDQNCSDWQFEYKGSMLDSNQALSWVVFERDRRRFEEGFPKLKVESKSHLPWAGYLLSGGVNLRKFFPDFLTPVIRKLDKLSHPLDPICAIHWHIRIRKLP